jgi:hypothetical protein
VEWDAVAANAMVAEPPSSAQRQASLRVNANVRGSVYLDDEYKGFTGGTVTLKPGIYHLKVSRYNFQSYQEIIHLSAGEQKVANVFLKRAASKKAKLRVESKVQQTKKDSPAFSVNSEFFVKVFQFRGHTYALSNKVMNRYAAKQFAEKYEGYLVNLNDAKEDQFVVGTFLSSRHKYLWIGINDIAHEGKWIWDGSSSNYTNWLPSQPGYPNTTENCAAYLYPDTQWHDVSCFPHKRVVVEWDAVAANASQSY